MEEQKAFILVMYGLKYFFRSSNGASGNYSITIADFQTVLLPKLFLSLPVISIRDRSHSWLVRILRSISNKWATLSATPNFQEWSSHRDMQDGSRPRAAAAAAAVTDDDLIVGITARHCIRYLWSAFYYSTQAERVH